MWKFTVKCEMQMYAGMYLAMKLDTKCILGLKSFSLTSQNAVLRSGIVLLGFYVEVMKEHDFFSFT